MAKEDLGKCITLLAAGDLSAVQFKFVKMSTTQVTTCGDGQDAVGVLQNKPAAAGRAAQVCINGVTKVVAGAVTTAGGYGASDSSGRAVDAVSGDYILGRFLEAAAVAGDVVSFLLGANPKL